MCILTPRTHLGAWAVSLSTVLLMFSGAILFGGSFPATDSGGDPEGGEQGDATWRIDLSKLVVQTEADWAYFGISFSGVETLVVGAARPVRKAEGPVARDLRAFLVDAHTGRILGTRVWPNVLASRLALVATQNGNFAVRDGRELAAYSPQLEELKRIPLPDARQKIFEEWRVLATPGGSLIVTAHVVGPKISIQWLQPETLAVQRSWELAEEIPRAKVFPHLSPSSHGVAISWNGPNGCDVSVQDAPTSWHAVLHDKRPCVGGVQYLNDETLFVSLKGEFQLLSMEGKLLRREVLQNGERALHGLSVSAEGGHFAVPISKFKGGVDLLDIAPHEVLERIEIRDSQTGQLLHTIKGKLKNVSGFALSPEGLRLALLRGELVELLQLSL